MDFPHRYARIEAIEGIGPEGVARLREGRVFVLGCGALGSLCSVYLAASGIGTLGIADFDTIDATNLQRQLFFDESSVGLPKAERLARRIADLNSEVAVTIYPEMITATKARDLFPLYDFIIDGSDNPATKIMTSRVCEELGIPYCIGGVQEFTGQVMSWVPGHCSYRDLFGDVASCTGLTPCSIAGVIGPAAGVVASVQAVEAIKYISGAGTLLTDRLLRFDLAAPTMEIFNL